MRGVDFYDEVLRELVFALGAALFLGNLLALVRRRASARVPEVDGALSAAPVARTLSFLVVGLVVAMWALASILTK